MSPTDEITSKKDDLERRRLALVVELNQLKVQEEAEAAERRAFVKRIWEFRLEPVTVTPTFERVMDSSVTLYRLNGRVLNRDEYVRAGNVEPKEGGMMYAFNTLSGKIVMSLGGGQIYINDGSWLFGGEKRGEAVEDAEVVFARLGAFLVEHPEGGDVTEIITAQRHWSYR